MIVGCGVAAVVSLFEAVGAMTACGVPIVATGTAGAPIAVPSGFTVALGLLTAEKTGVAVGVLDVVAAVVAVVPCCICCWRCICWIWNCCICCIMAICCCCIIIAVFASIGAAVVPAAEGATGFDIPKGIIPGK